MIAIVIAPSRALIRHTGQRLEYSGKPPKWMARYLTGDEVVFPPGGHADRYGLYTDAPRIGPIRSEDDLLEALRAIPRRRGFDGFAVIEAIEGTRDWYPLA